MNAGRDYKQAKAQAQANADYTKTPRWLHGYNGVWWVSREPVRDAERIVRFGRRGGVVVKGV